MSRAARVFALLACAALPALLGNAALAQTSQISDLEFTGATTRYIFLDPPVSAGVGNNLSITAGPANGANTGGSVGIGGGFGSVAFGNVLLSTAGGNVGIGTASPQHRLSVSGSMYSVRNPLTDGATIAVDWNNGNTQSVTLGGNRTFTFANGQDGAFYTLILRQDATGSRTVTWPASCRFPYGYTPRLTITANKTDYIGFVYNAATATYDEIAFTPDL